MKPLRLTLTEVRSFPGACSIDITDRHLPSAASAGLGKSAVLEAITFALYGAHSWPKDTEEPSRIALEDTTTEAS